MMIDDFIETSLSSIKSLNTEIDDISSKKKEIEERLSSKRKALEEIRNNILLHMNQNSVKYYSNGESEVIIKNSPKTYEIQDENNLIEYLKSVGEYKKCCKEEIKIDKRKLNQILADMSSSDSVPSCIKVVSGEPSLQIKSAITVQSDSGHEEKNFSKKLASTSNSSQDLDIDSFDSL
jgi:hypothetical protein